MSPTKIHGLKIRHSYYIIYMTNLNYQNKNIYGLYPNENTTQTNMCEIVEMNSVVSLLWPEYAVELLQIKDGQGNFDLNYI